MVRVRIVDEEGEEPLVELIDAAVVLRYLDSTLSVARSVINV